MKDYEIACIANIYLVIDENGHENYVVTESELYEDENTFYINTTWFTQIGCVVSEGSICYPVRCGGNF